MVPEGNYHIVSNYGDTNAVVRSDIRVQAGKLTDATVNHRAALITLKLVNERGGEALANTGWSVHHARRRRGQGIDRRLPARWFSPRATIAPSHAMMAIPTSAISR